MNFRHDRLRRGICINRCKKLLSDLEDPESLFVDGEVPLDSESFYNVTYYRKQYNKITNKCVNLGLRKYNLTAYSSIEYCAGETAKVPFDCFDALCLVLMFGITLLVTVASLFDSHLKGMKKLTNEHYKMDLEESRKFIKTWDYLHIITRNICLLKCSRKLRRNMQILSNTSDSNLMI